MKFKKGDVVLLKSGGPDMTVEEVYPHLETVYCRWFVRNHSYSDEFDCICLVKKYMPAQFSIKSVIISKGV